MPESTILHRLLCLTGLIVFRRHRYGSLGTIIGSQNTSPSWYGNNSLFCQCFNDASYTMPSLRCHAFVADKFITKTRANDLYCDNHDTALLFYSFAIEKVSLDISCRFVSISIIYSCFMNKQFLKIQECNIEEVAVVRLDSSSVLTYILSEIYCL